MTPWLPRRVIQFGIERLPPARDAERHLHERAYVTVVLDGAYVQLAYAGRLRIEAGDVVLQPSFDCHSDRMLSCGVTLLRIPWRREAGLGGIYRGCDVDLIRRVASSDREALDEVIDEQLQPPRRLAPRVDHRADALALRITRDPRVRIGSWAEREGLAPESLSRSFRSAYGVSPVQFRSEIRARRAWADITGSAEPLSAIAAEHGYADQAHMTRAVRWYTGLPPARLRRATAAHGCRPANG